MIFHQPIKNRQHVLLQFLKVYHFDNSKILKGYLNDNKTDFTLLYHFRDALTKP